MFYQWEQFLLFLLVDIIGFILYLHIIIMSLWVSYIFGHFLLVLILRFFLCIFWGWRVCRVVFQIIRLRLKDEIWSLHLGLCVRLLVLLCLF